VKPKAVLAYCREKGIRFVDLRFSDNAGRWNHFTIPASALSENSFSQGFGLADFSPHSHIIAVPNPEQSYLDPLQSSPTLILFASVANAQTAEVWEYDSREVAKRSIEAVRSVGLADSVSVQLAAPFCYRTASSINSNSEHSVQPDYLTGGRADRDAALRGEIAELCSEAGVGIERHFLGNLEASEILLSPKSLVNACDDLLVLRSILESHALSKNLEFDPMIFTHESYWILSKNAEPMIGGMQEFALSELALFAAGGVIKHQAALAAVASAASAKRFPAPEIGTVVGRGSSFLHCRGILAEHDLEALVSVHYGSFDPRHRALSVRGLQSNACPYLVLSATLMAMIDGILNKIQPCTPSTQSVQNNPNSGYLRFHESDLYKSLEQDYQFLTFADVFSEQLIQGLVNSLR
jgi:glutamine synthetase